MASTNVKYTVLTNYVNAPTERNFNKIATVFIDDINMIVYSNTYGYEYNIFGEDITSKTLLVLWNKLKDFKLDSDPHCYPKWLLSRSANCCQFFYKISKKHCQKYIKKRKI